MTTHYNKEPVKSYNGSYVNISSLASHVWHYTKCVKICPKQCETVPNMYTMLSHYPHINLPLRRLLSMKMHKLQLFQHTRQTHW